MDQITSSSASVYIRNSSLNLQIYFPLEVLFATIVDCDPDHFLCVPRKDPDYALPNKLAKNAQKSPQALPYQYHQL